MFKPEKLLTINLAERNTGFQSETGETVVHTFLFLADAGMRPTIYQQLHFNDEAVGNKIVLRPNVRTGISSQNRMKGIHYFPFLGGKAADILPVWNHGLAYANAFTAFNEEMDEFEYMRSSSAKNCRMLARATMRVMGIEVDDDCFAHYAGLSARPSFLGQVFNHEAPNVRSFEEELRINLNFVGLLTPKWLDGERVIEPLTEPLLPMPENSFYKL